MAIESVVITGAGQGIGKAAALQLAKSSVSVLCLSKTANARKTAEEIRQAGGSAESLVLDIGDWKAVEKAMGAWVLKARDQKIGVVLAAASLGPQGPLEKSSLEEWEACYRVSVLGNLAVLQALLPGMLKRCFGRIVTFAGGGSAYAYPLFPAYSAAKTAMVRITENLHEDLKDKGDFAVACLAPGAVETAMLRKVKEAGAYVKTQVPISTPVAFIEKFLNADACSFSGCLVHVLDNWEAHLDGGAKLKTESLWKLRRIE